MKKLLKYWQNRLDLNDWIIEVEDDCFKSDLKTKDACGECEWDAVNKCAIIRIISEKEYGNRQFPYIKEEILLHELLHIKFALLWQNNTDLQNDLLHQIIEDLAKSLYLTHNSNAVISLQIDKENK